MKYYKVSELATRWGVKPSTITAKIKSGELFSIKLFGSHKMVRVPENEVQRIEKGGDK